MIIENKGGWLSSKTVKEGELLIISDEGQKIENKKFKKPDGSIKYDYVFKVKRSDGSVHLISVNPTSARMIADKFGSDTALWLDKTVKVHTALMPTGNKMILLEPIGEI